ncbi:MAG TPA: hypothetical protein VGQ37_13340 [Vicinamibacterales bacterium]|nr:hypothetical protein [Vicinamibacterales bacterium]
MLTTLDPPRTVDQHALQIAGLNERHGNTASAAIPAQWQRFAPHLDHVPGQIGHTAYGVDNSDTTSGSTDARGTVKSKSGCP